MRFVSRAALVLLLVVGACFLIGCSEKTTGPDKNLSAGNCLWSKRFGDGETQVARAVHVDASGNVVITGNFQSIADFGGGALTSAGDDDIFVAKFGSDGTHLWSKRFGDGEDQRAHAVAVDASGNVIVTGHFKGTVDFGGGMLTSSGSWDIFIAKFGSDGSHLWSKRFGDGNSQWANAVAVDVSGNVIVAGDFVGTVNFGGGAFTSSGSEDIYVAKFGSDGTHIWSYRFGDGSSQWANAVAVDASGNVLVTGQFSGTVNFGGGALTSSGNWDIYVVKFGPDCTHSWSGHFGDGDYQMANAVAVDAAGNVIVTGSFSGSVDFGGGVFRCAGDEDIFVAKFGSDGTHLWSNRFGDDANIMAAALAVAVDVSENIIVTGDFLLGTVDFGGGTLTSAGGLDIFVAKFESDGTHLWSKRFGDGEDQVANALAFDASGNVIVTGRFRGTVDFGCGLLTSAGYDDIFIAKLDW